MDQTEAGSPPQQKYLTLRQAAFIGVGAMVGAGIFALLGAAGEVAGAAVWLSFLIAGAIAGLQGYSFAKLGARYPSAGGMLEYVAKGFGNGHLTGITSWLTYSANAIVTAMVAVSFGSYASSMFAGEDKIWAKVFAALIIVVMTGVNIVGSKLVANAQTVIVYVVLGILVIFAVVTIANMNPSLLAPSKYPPLRDIVSSVALTFFAFLGFGIITFTAKDLRQPSRQLPRAMYLALGIATIIYIAIALGVFGTLTVRKVISSGSTALGGRGAGARQGGLLVDERHRVVRHRWGDQRGTVPGSRAVRAAGGNGAVPPLMARRLGGRASAGLLIEAAACLVLALVFKLDAIASIGSAVALLIFTFITAAHFRVRGETGASAAVLAVAIATAGAVLLTFVFTTLFHEPASIVTLVAILVLSIALDFGWKRARVGRADHLQAAH